jgi:hypothetical protein
MIRRHSYPFPLVQHRRTASHAMPRPLPTTPAPRTRARAAEIPPATAGDPWPYCPHCHQSATGQYLGAAACARCGWPATPHLA